MYGLSIYEIKRIYHHAQFFIISWNFSAFCKFFGKKTQVLNIKLKYLLSPSSFFILILINAHDLKLSRKCENVFVFPSRVELLHVIYFGNSPKKDFYF